MTADHEWVSKSGRPWSLRVKSDLCSKCGRTPDAHDTDPASQAAALRQEVDELRATFDLRWKADQRAIKRWQKAHPGNDLVWPDHADLVVWLMEQLQEARQ